MAKGGDSRIVDIGIDTIVTDGRLRHLNQDWARILGDEMERDGQHTPISVTTPDREGRRFLIDGMHRIEGRRLHGRDTITAIGKDVDPATRERLEIAAELFHQPLTTLSRAVFLSRLKELYEARHPETRRGVAGGKARQGSATDKLSFAADAADRIGLSERSIERAVALVKRIPPKVRDRLAGTPFEDKGTEPEALAKLEPTDQVKAVDMLVRDDDPAPSVAAAVKVIQGHTARPEKPEEKQYRALMTAWARAPQKVRHRFLDAVVSEGFVSPNGNDTLVWIDTPADDGGDS